ncbi:hypothetical protein KCP74_06980 [Salmonella enterica subsp. enterica]|nr:hypothetical protein KCP74_06980 [Salmonella enterica subsp. enterica]
MADPGISSGSIFGAQSGNVLLSGNSFVDACSSSSRYRLARVQKGVRKAGSPRSSRLRFRLDHFIQL